MIIDKQLLVDNLSWLALLLVCLVVMWKVGHLGEDDHDMRVIRVLTLFSLMVSNVAFLLRPLGSIGLLSEESRLDLAIALRVAVVLMMLWAMAIILRRWGLWLPWRRNGESPDEPGASS